MKILIVTTEIGMDGGGLSLSCTRLADLLSRKHTVEVINSTTVPIHTANGGVSPYLQKSIRLEYKLKEETFKYQDFNTVIGFGGRYNGYYASMLAARINARFILCLRGSDINLCKWTVEDSWFQREASAKADRIVCLSKEMKGNILLVNPEVSDKVIVIPNSVEKKSFHITFSNLPNTVKIGCAASHLNEKKGIGNLFYMISEFKAISKIQIKMELVGDIDEDLKEDYMFTIQHLGLQDDITFINKTSRDGLGSIMKSWDFYVQGSVCEGHPNAITEALQNGCAFISSNTGYIAEILSSNYPELFFKDWNPKSMAISLINLISLEKKDVIYSDAYNMLLQYCNEEYVEELWNSLFAARSKRIEISNNIEHIVAVGLHDIQGELHDSITTPILVFEKFVERIYLSGYGLCSMKGYLKKKTEERRKWIVCTFDDGYKGLFDYALPILNKYGFSATVFICTGLIGKDNRWNNKDAVIRKHLDMEELNILHTSGWEIASHGVTHTNLLKLTDLELDDELKRSHDDIVQKWGASMTYAYPYGAYNAYIRSCVKKYYQFAFSVSSGGTSLVVDSLQLKRYSITEIYQMLSIKE